MHRIYRLSLIVLSLTSTVGYPALDSKMRISIPSGGYNTTSATFNGLSGTVDAASNALYGTLAFSEKGGHVFQFPILETAGLGKAAKWVPADSGSTTFATTDSDWLYVDGPSLSCTETNPGLYTIDIKPMKRGAVGGDPYIAYCQGNNCTPESNDVPLTYGSVNPIELFSQGDWSVTFDSLDMSTYANYGRAAKVVVNCP